MYHTELSLLKPNENVALTAATATSKHRKTNHAVVESITLTNRAQRAAERRKLLERLQLDDDVDMTAIVKDESDTPFSACARESVTLQEFFAEPLPNVLVRAIPFGTPSLSESGERPMDGSYIETVAGASDLTIGKYSPQVSYFIRNSRAAKTRELYRWAWDRALSACRDLDLCPMPMSVSTAATVIVDAVNDGLVYGSLKIIACVMSAAHEIAGETDPTRTAAFRAMMRGIGRAIGDRPSRKEAITVEDLRLIYEASLQHKQPIGARDWAMISVGFGGAFRRSELVSRNVDDCEFRDDHLRIWLDRSKTDKYGNGTYVIIQPAKDPTLCPIAALTHWIARLPGPGPLFRPVGKHGIISARRLSAEMVSKTVKAYGVVLDLSEDRLGAHSLRAGMITALIDTDLATEKTMKHSRHKQSETLMKYYRPRGLGPNMTQAAGL